VGGVRIPRTSAHRGIRSSIGKDQSYDNRCHPTFVVPHCYAALGILREKTAEKTSESVSERRGARTVFWSSARKRAALRSANIQSHVRKKSAQGGTWLVAGTSRWCTLAAPRNPHKGGADPANSYENIIFLAAGRNRCIAGASKNGPPLRAVSLDGQTKRIGCG